MSYTFIDFKKSSKDDLVNHLREQCGIEKDGKKEELIQAILDFESANGLIRHDIQKQDDNQSEADQENIPLTAQKRVRIIISPSETDKDDVYVSIGNWDALIKRGVEVSIPYPAYLLLSKAGEKRLVQNKEGGLDEFFAPRFSITVLGDA